MDVESAAATAASLEKKNKKEKKEKRHHKADGTSSSASKKRKHESRATGDAERKKKKKKAAEQHESFLESEAATFSPKPKKVKSSSTGGSAAAAASETAEEGVFKRQAKATKRGSSSPYHLITSTFYLPLSPISISPSHALSSLLSEHLSPLLLTYYPPFRGLILAYSNPSMSSTPPKTASTDTSSTAFKPLTLAKTAGEYGVMFVYVTATFLVFHPERGQIFEGWVNVQSEGFLGAIVNNLFSVGIDRRRLPKDWKWVAPGEGTFSSASSVAGTEVESEYERDAGEGADVDEDKDVSKGPNSVGLIGNKNSVATLENAEDDSTGYFVTPSGKRVRGTIRFRVRDVDVIPGSERDKGFITIEGSMLSAEEEEKLIMEEKIKLGGGKAADDSSRNGSNRQTLGNTLEDTAVNEESAGAIAQDDAMDIDEPLHEEVDAVKVKKEKKDKKDKKDKKKDKKSKKSS